MKTYIITALLLSTALCISAQSNSKYTISDEEVHVRFTASWTFDDIIAAREDLRKHGILLHYTLLEFTESGQLKRINAAIDYRDGRKGSFTSDDLTNLDRGPGFRRDFTEHPRGPIQKNAP